ncbi:helix-turn-helix transcriptional regulator [Ligilactobacillus agilis]|uniref:helix-turn-helix domain-containing protein n=1 Tax=Ligilactobacillus agilis TaxID=1601 RepID=UPI0025A3BF03|nr:helix-turn-helix transcriptional regulator [Ligilactobacillus agilis]MDM8279679.1 helix-turn-helix transcriptional regulator [Ligilactobacillus agilis]
MHGIGYRVSELRKQAGMSQFQLAKVLHIGQSTLAMYEKNKRKPSLEMLSAIADYFNVTTDYLLGRPEKQTESRQQTINEAIETAMANDGKELDQHDKDVIKSLIEAYLDNK